jgi:hypothetical protein
MRKKSILISLSVILLFSSCTPDHCFEGTESFFKIGFYDYASLTPFPPDSVTIYGNGMDTAKIYNGYVKLQTALLPLNPVTENVEFMIIINGIADTMRVYYTSYDHFVSRECGFTFHHNLTSDSVSITNNGIDSIFIKSGNITLSNEENLQIFY